MRKEIFKSFHFLYCYAKKFFLTSRNLLLLKTGTDHLCRGSEKNDLTCHIKLLLLNC